MSSTRVQLAFATALSVVALSAFLGTARAQQAQPTPLPPVPVEPQAQPAPAPQPKQAQPAPQPKQIAQPKAAPKAAPKQAAAAPKATPAQAPVAADTIAGFAVTGFPGGQQRSKSLTVPTTAEAQRELATVPGAVSVVSDTAYRSTTPANTIKDVLDYVPGVIAQTQMGRRYAAINSWNRGCPGTSTCVAPTFI